VDLGIAAQDISSQKSMTKWAFHEEAKPTLLSHKKTQTCGDLNSPNTISVNPFTSNFNELLNKIPNI
jgi:hypothetical protein